ncbi:MAG: hypothetical protein QOG04_1815 [Actinomycetota bacterium]|jgi:hypothetical protein|nr:hypothetical protein [Actinomycetota bacterium]
MFIQVVQGKAKDEAGLKKQWERWDQEVKPQAIGYLGGTAGVTPDGEFIALARFESEEAAKKNSDSAEQSKWWEETSQYIDNPMFHDCNMVSLSNGGGSDEAGFVQVMQGKTTDIAKAKELDAGMEERMKGLRPDVLGSVTAGHENGRYTTAIYFRSESEARAKEKEMQDSEEFKKSMAEWADISDGEPKFFDLTDPWYSTK